MEPLCALPPTTEVTFTLQFLFLIPMHALYSFLAYVHAYVALFSRRVIFYINGIDLCTRPGWALGTLM